MSAPDWFHKIREQSVDGVLAALAAAGLAVALGVTP